MLWALLKTKQNDLSANAFLRAYNFGLISHIICLTSIQPAICNKMLGIQYAA